MSFNLKRSRENLYKWVRTGTPDENHSITKDSFNIKSSYASNNKNFTSTSDIDDWLKTIENVSLRATASALDTKEMPSYLSRHMKQNKQADNTKKLIAITADNVHLHGQAEQEAHELLNEWVAGKLTSSEMNDDLMGDEDDILSRENKKTTKIKDPGTFLSILNIDDDTANMDFNPSAHNSANIIDRISKINEDDVTSELLNDLMTKDYVNFFPTSTFNSYDNDYFINYDNGAQNQKNTNKINKFIPSYLKGREVSSGRHDEFLGLATAKTMPKSDPALKMKMRQEQARQRREAAEMKRKTRLRETQARKEATSEAARIVQEEEQAAKVKADNEEAALQEEIQRIRKDLEMQKKKREEEKRHAQKLQELRELETKQEKWREKVAKEKAEEERVKRTADLKVRLHQVQARRLHENLKLMRRCFSAWLSLLASSRVAFGEAAALADWRLTMKCFSAWKLITQRNRLDQEAAKREQIIKKKNRLWNIAVSYSNQSMLQKCLNAWIKDFRAVQLRREIEMERIRVHTRINKFVEAASEGKLWRDDNKKSKIVNPVTQVIDIESEESENELPSNHFTLKEDVIKRGKFKNTEKFKPEVNQRHDVAEKKPREAWQITKSHIQEMTSAPKDDSPKQRHSTPKPFAVLDTYHHRHESQQKALKEQQKQIEKQQRLLEDLQVAQRQQLLLQQLQTQQLMQIQTLGVMPNDIKALRLQKQVKATVSDPVSLENETIRSESNTLSTDQTKTMSAGSVKQKNSKKARNIALESILTSRETDKPETNGKLFLGETVEKTTAPSKLGSNFDTEVIPIATEMSGKLIPSQVIPTTRVEITSQRSRRSNITSTGSDRHNQFLRRMEERQLERQRMKREREERQRRIELEKAAKIEAEEAERKRMEEEKRKAEIEAYREKRRKEREAEKERQKAFTIMREKEEKADIHYDISLIKYHGWFQWRRCTHATREKTEQANKHYVQILLSKHMLSWYIFVQRHLSEHRKMADDFYHFCLLRKSIHQWKNVKHSMAISKIKAERHFKQKLLEKKFGAWAGYVADEKIASWERERDARRHNFERMMKKAFHAWKRLPEFMKIEREKEKRKEEMRRKVASMIPDFGNMKDDDKHFNKTFSTKTFGDNSVRETTVGSQKDYFLNAVDRLFKERDNS